MAATTKLFLSYSSRDKTSVLRLAKELRKRGFRVWLDEWEIEVGDSIPGRIAEGLAEARYVGVWLTKHSVSSGWVTKEWQTTIFQEISRRQISVLPLLAEDCDLPLFLSDKKFADFRLSFRDGVDGLARALKRRKPISRQSEPDQGSFSISDYTRKFLGDLDEAQIPFPTLGNLRVIRSLKALPRSGKLLRLESMTPVIPIRSIFDHVLSVAHSADCLLPLVAPSLEGRDCIDLARVIAYHDLCEVIIGDIPQYTRLNRTKRSRARVSAEIRLSQLAEGEPERISNEFIGMYLHDSERASLRRAMEILGGRSDVRRLFYALDKLDPIVAIWRYVHHFRDNKHFSIDEFLDRTRHFFENPQVRIAVGKYADNIGMVELVDHLQNPARARQYFHQEELLQEELFSFAPDEVRHLIEDRELLFVLPRGSRSPTSLGPPRP